MPPRNIPTAFFDQVPKVAVLPIPLVGALLLWFWLSGSNACYESPAVLLGLNFVFGTVISLFVCYLITRKFLNHGTPGLLLFGCGIILWGVAGTAGAIAAMRPGGFSPNITVTIHNTCAWAAGLCHLLGSAWSVRWNNRLDNPSWWITGAYGTTLFLVTLLVVCTLREYMPIFFIQGTGGTLVRQMVLLSGSLLFLSSAVLILDSARRHSTFYKWYMLALVLIGTCLLGLAGITLVGGIMNWVVRVGQAAAGGYLLVAALSFRQEADHFQQEVGPSARTRQGLLVTVALVSAAMVFRMILFQEADDRFPFVTYYAVVTFAALYGGWSAGIMATMLSVAFTTYFWIGKVGFNAVAAKDAVGITVFAASSFALSLGSAMLRRIEHRVLAAEMHAQQSADRLAEQMRSEEALRQAHAMLEQRVMERTAELNSALMEIQEKEHILLQQSRSAAMGEMINNIAHQWRQPLNTLGLLIQQLEMVSKSGRLSHADVEKSVRDAMAMIQHMSRTIDDFRNFFRPDKTAGDFSLGQSVRDALALMTPSLEASYIKVTLTQSGERSVFGYANEFSQVIMNILTNAKDELVGRNTPSPQITLHIAAEGDEASVIIEDNAGGIPEEILPRLFDPYFTTKSQGTGIGLFMAKNIIERSMNGRLSACNSTSGARFTISF